MNHPLCAAAGLGLALLASAAVGQERPRDLASYSLPKVPAHRVERGQPLAACPQPGEAGTILRESRGEGFTVDACGRRVSDSGEWLPWRAAQRGLTARTMAAAPVTIDRMTTRLLGAGHAAGGPLTLVGYADTYSLSDGSNWSSGAGSISFYAAPLDHVEVSGTTLRYVLAAPDGGLIYRQSDFDSGDHSAQGALGAAGALVVEAETGSTTAVLRGNALVVANDATSVPQFNYYTAPVGSVVPFEISYTMQSGTWTADAFSRSFSYSVTGFVDFAHPVSTPRAVALSITGPSRVPAEFTTRFVATVRYESGVERDASAVVSWTVDPAAVASVAGGVLTTGTLQTPEVDLTLRAAFVQGADSLTAEKRVPCLADDPAEKPGTWPMFQANARHTGYVGAAPDPATFNLRWQRNLGGGLALNPVAAGDGKVFVTRVTFFDDVPTLFALRARDGATLWSQGFGSVFSVNPPSYAYGNVYVQTGDHASNTWLRAFDGDTGATIFKAPHEAQWERYFAPTIYDGKAYVNGGYYGGMYAFDAYTGDQLWFAALSQYDQWTPAVDAGRAYAYVGDYASGLYARERPTGAPALFVADPNFVWNGWSMNLAPVIGAHDDVIAIHDGRLLSFDTVAGAIRWQLQSQFAGQPSVAQDRIYAIDGGRLRVLDELTHAEIWSWQADDGPLAGPMIVTGTHVFVSTGQSVHAVDLGTRQAVWSYPVGGHLAIADDTLYVASQNGVLSAFATPPALSFYTLSPCRLVDTRVAGPALQPGSPRTFVATGACGVPDTAAALSVNVTVTGPTAAGHLVLAPGGQTLPLASNVNFGAGQTRANNAILGLAIDGSGAFVVTSGGTGTVDFILDVNGYFQ
jgi:outer membrane protein assembly factor BamB